MIVYRDPKYIKATNVSADIVGEWVHRAQIESIHIAVEQDIGGGAGLPLGTIQPESTNDPAKTSGIYPTAPITVYDNQSVFIGTDIGTNSIRLEWFRLRWVHQPGAASIPNLIVRVVGRDQ